MRSENDIITNQQLVQLKQMPLGKLRAWLIRFYQEAFEDGLREAETEFDDTEKYVFIDADEAQKVLGAETLEKLLSKGEN